jgi:hypothetical protein
MNWTLYPSPTSTSSLLPFLMHRTSHFERNRWLYAGLLVFAVLFYWFQIRPIYIYRNCAVEASIDARKLLASKAAITTDVRAAQYQSLMERNMYLRSDYESFLRKCLLFHGRPLPEEEPEATE